MSERSWVRAPDFSRIILFNTARGLQVESVNEAAEQGPVTHPDYLGRVRALAYERVDLVTYEELQAEADRLLQKHGHARRFVQRDGEDE